MAALFVFSLETEKTKKYADTPRVQRIQKISQNTGVSTEMRAKSWSLSLIPMRTGRHIRLKPKDLRSSLRGEYLKPPQSAHSADACVTFKVSASSSASP